MNHWLTVLRHPELRRNQWRIFRNDLLAFKLRAQILWLKARRLLLR